MTCTHPPTQPPAACAARHRQRRQHAGRPARSVLLATVLLLAVSPAIHAQTLTPGSLANTLFHAKITGSTGGLPGSGTFTQLFTEDTDYNVALADAAPAAPASYVYTALDADSATIVETDVTVALEFTSTTAGTFASAFTAGGTQSGTFTLEPLAPPPLVNISTRLTLMAGSNAIAGFVLAGHHPRRLLVRVVGPGLADHGVPEPLADPKFTVFSGNTPIADNDNWDADAGNRDEVRAAEASTGAFALKAASTDAAMIVELEPGSYTVIGTSVNSEDHGEILVEVYLIE